MHRLKAGSIIFQCLKDNDAFNQAVDTSSVIAQSSTPMFAIHHVSLYVGDGFVIEATRTNGVIKRPLAEFLLDGLIHIVAVVKDRRLLKFATENANKYVGLPYKHRFYPNSQGLYCSELIMNAFRYPNGQYYFQAYPMNFCDIQTKEILPYWLKYYHSLGGTIPQGILGSNPLQLLQQKSLLDILFSIPQ